MKILFIFPYPHAKAPSQRFRFEQYLTFLTEQNIEYDLAPFMDNPTWKILYQRGKHFQKIWGILKGFVNRWGLMFQIPRYDFIFIHREASPIGLPVFEWLIAKIFRKKIIFDFDDAIWLPNTSKQNALAAKLKFHTKTAWICKWSYKISVGNHFLGEYAQQFNPNIVFNPTTIDTENLHNPALYPAKQQNEPKTICIGWTGTHSTIKYLNELIPILRKLEQTYSFRFLVISNQPPDFHLNSLEFVAWNKKTEIPDLMRMDVGVMPLTDDPWAKGKCGFKALQYMALGIPALVSPVGVNTVIVEDGVNGFICQTEEEWENALKKLIEDGSLRKNLGENAQLTIQKHYSVLSNKENFLNLFS